MHSTLESVPSTPTPLRFGKLTGEGKGVKCESGESPYRMTHHNLSGCIAKKGGFREGTQEFQSPSSGLSVGQHQDPRLSQALILHNPELGGQTLLPMPPRENIPVSTAHLLNFTPNSRASSFFHSFLYSAHVC